MSKVITANRLSDGRVVYLGADGDWVASVSDAQVFAADAIDAALAACGTRMTEVADVYAIEADADGTPSGRAALRETIRASGGPTIPFHSSPCSSTTEGRLH